MNKTDLLTLLDKHETFDFTYWIMRSFAEQCDESPISPEDFLIYLERNLLCLTKPFKIMGEERESFEQLLSFSLIINEEKRAALNKDHKCLKLKNFSGWMETTILHVAVYSQDLLLVEKLYKGNCDINICNSQGSTSLINAIHPRWVKKTAISLLFIEKFIKDFNVNIHHKNHHGKSALDVALALSQDELVRLLLSEGAVINYGNRPKLEDTKKIISIFIKIKKCTYEKIIENDFKNNLEVKNSLSCLPNVLHEIIFSYIPPIIKYGYFFKQSKTRCFFEEKNKEKNLIEKRKAPLPLVIKRKWPCSIQ